MKQQIRKNIFETNSSSMHAIVVTNSKPDTEDFKYRTLEFKVGEFGWEHIRYYDPDAKASYLWTIIVNSFLKKVYTGVMKKGWNDTEYEEYYLVLDKENPEYIQIKNDIIDKLKAVGMNEDELRFSFQENFETTSYGSIETGYVDHDPGLGFVKQILYGPNDRFIRFMFNHDSIIETWNDNDWYCDEDDDDDTVPDYDKDPDAYREYWDNRDWKYFGIDPYDKTIEWKYLKTN